MAQEYYSFMMNRFFETLFIQLMANVHKMFSKICSAAQALWKILLEICRKCRYFMVFLSKCCGEELKEKEMVKVPGWFLSNDGTAPIFILIVHKFKLKVSVCIAR